MISGTIEPSPGNPKRRGSLFLRTAAFSTIVSMLALVIFGLKVLNHQRDTLRQSLESRARLLALAIERVLPRGDVSQVKLEADRCLAFANAPDEVPFLVITLEGGESLSWTKDGWREIELHGHWTPPQHQWNSSQVRVSEFSDKRILHYNHRVTTPDGQSGWVHVGVNLGGYETSVGGLVLRTSALALPAVVIGCLASFIFSSRLIRPIQDLRRFAEQVASGDFSSRVEVRSNTEFAVLGETMNHMAAKLRESQEQDKEARQREARLREQEVLLKEIHHRVKNNLQVLSSLLRMQARRSPSADLKSILQECEGRVRSMGLIHERLYQSKSLSAIEFGEYVKALTLELIRMHQAQGRAVEFRIDIPDVRLSLDTAMPCGLIINELVSNSLKYAFPDRNEGVIQVSVKPDGADQYLMEVSDNGVGLPKDKPPREGSLGMRLVHMLVEQISGDIEFRNGCGTTAAIRFRECNYQTRV